MRVQIVRRLRGVDVELLKLVDGKYESLAEAASGQVFEAGEPFEMRFAASELLP